MHHPSGPPNRSDGSIAVTTTEERGDPTPDSTTGSSTQTSLSNDSSEQRPGHPESSGGGEPESQPRYRTNTISSHDSLGVFHTRSIFHLPRRSSSGYFSSDGDSVPSSPFSPRPVTADRATQTPSLTGQVMNHALQRMAAAPSRESRTRQLHGNHLSPSSTRQQNAAGDMQAVAVGRELRRIGDHFNNHLLARAMAGRHRWAAIHPIRLPHFHQDPAVLLCVGLLLFVIGRLIYSQGSTNSQGHSQV